MSGSGAVPERCTACGTEMPSGAVRCPACGKVYGEDNRCPHCQNTAGVVPQGAGFVCAACGNPREKRPDTVVLAAPAGGGAGPGSAALRRGASTGLRLFGALSIGGGVLLAAIAAALIPGTAGFVVAALVGGAGVGVGALALRAGAGQAERAGSLAQADRERQLFELAERSDGDLTVTEAARGLGIPMAEADSALTALADGSRVTVELDPEGILHFVFRELAPSVPPARMRVGSMPAGRGAADDALAEEIEEAARRTEARQRGD